VTPIPIIDLFAGPGGLNEGFSRLGEDVGSPIFGTIGSFEMESTAIDTLTLRSAYRYLLRSEGGVPDSYYAFIQGRSTLHAFRQDERVEQAFMAASEHVHRVELGGDDDNSEEIIRRSLELAGVTDSSSAWVLIGGPPCQAYSLAGRSRRANDETFADDKKHYLYREYLHIIRQFAPPVFVMENVKGLLSSTNKGRGMFELIKNDLEHPSEHLRYDIHSVVVDDDPSTLQPKDFIIKAEKFGIPQKRHRVILLGVRRDFAPTGFELGRLVESGPVTVEDALIGLPPLRSGISPASRDSDEAWLSIRRLISELHGAVDVEMMPRSRGSASEPRIPGKNPTGELGSWIIDSRLEDAIQHHARSHMPEDLKRYWYASNRAQNEGVSPRLRDFPAALQPLHKNAGADSRPFEDRFRVQVANDASTTIVSHISKDGHYYIHHDPAQMRSLTVREAARLQTFPDNYFFMGNRTQQFHQVGNAVPPLLANKIARVVAELFVG
jgi:DNA (cytosine-5)-methyltransferase 1